MRLMFRHSSAWLPVYCRLLCRWRKWPKTFVILLLLFPTVMIGWTFKDSNIFDRFDLFHHVPDKYIGSYFKYCNGLANQMYRYASLYAIGKQIGREPYIDSTLECTSLILPELSASMPDFFKRLYIFPTPNSQVKRVDFAKNCCKYDNVSKLVGLHPGAKFMKVNSNLLQSFKFFHHEKQNLRRIFDFNDNVKNYVHTFANQLFGNSSHHKLCVHTRLGDFEEHDYLLASKHSFVNPAIEFVGKELLKNYTKLSIVLLGTDKKFIEGVDVPRDVFVNNFQPMDLSRTEELYFGATYCNSYLITASGSTFAWWMAYLMNEEAQNRIFYNYLTSRHKKFGKDIYDFDSFPQEWKRLRLFNVNKIGYEPRWHKDIKDDRISVILHRRRR
ncbi:hypothetical protein M3Y97_00001500 [Aphelenchoides bicaudatus]|nr:hypothetical protein M3Y97_00001500 [Aphelenchoides bicaudatus]